jgi:hypothetical protein
MESLTYSFSSKSSTLNGRIINEIQNQDMLFHSSVPNRNHSILKKVIVEYDFTNSIFETLYRNFIHNKDNLQLELDKHLLKRKMYLTELCKILA